MFVQVIVTGEDFSYNSCIFFVQGFVSSSRFHLKTSALGVFLCIRDHVEPIRSEVCEEIEF